MKSFPLFAAIITLALTTQAVAQATSNAPFSTQSQATPNNGSSPSLLSAILGRIVSLDDGAGITHNGVTDDTAASQSVLNAVAASGGGTVLVGAHQYALGSSVNATIQPTSATFNVSGFTLFIPNASTYFVAGQSINLTGFTAPFAGLNGTWSINSANSITIVVLTAALGGSQAQTSTGIGTLYENLTIPSNVQLFCPKNVQGRVVPGQSFSMLPFSFLVNSAVTIAPSHDGGIVGCNITNSAAAIANVVQSTMTTRQAINSTAAFAGTGIYVGNADDTELRDLSIIGFATGINSYFGARGRWENLNIDATACIATDHSHDISRYRNIHCHPFALADAPTSATTPFATVTGVANNGSGLWRVMTALATTAIVGDTVYISNVVGTGSVNNAWVVAATDGSTYVDLTASIATGTSSYTATTTQQSFCLKSMSSVAGIGIGDTITGTGIPGATTVTDVLPLESSVCMSAVAAATASGITITTTPAAYSSGGVVYLDAMKRRGAAYSWTNGEVNSCVSCFSYGHKIGFLLGTGSKWVSLQDTQVDSFNLAVDPSFVCYQLDGDTAGNSIVGGSTQSCYTSVLGATSNTSQANIISGMVLNGVKRVMELKSGRYIFAQSSSSFGNATAFVGDGISNLILSATDFKIAWEFQSATGFNAVSPDNTFAAGAYNGTFNLLGVVNLGGGVTNCNQFNNCGIAMNGPLSDAAPGVSSPATGATITLSGNKQRYFIRGSGTWAALTVTLPAATQFLKYELVFEQAVTALTLNATGGTVLSPPTTVAAAKVISCQYDTSNTTWFCN